jgi:hypothetical protein
MSENIGNKLFRENSYPQGIYSNNKSHNERNNAKLIKTATLTEN